MYTSGQFLLYVSTVKDRNWVGKLDYWGLQIFALYEIRWFIHIVMSRIPIKCYFYKIICYFLILVVQVGYGALRCIGNIHMGFPCN